MKTKTKQPNSKILVVLIFVLTTLHISTSAFSQSVGISGDYFAIDSSALLELKDTTKGFLMTRLTTTQRDNISGPAEGLMIYNTTTKCVEMYIGGWYTLSCPLACEAPAQPGFITGDASHCAGLTGQTYSISAVSNATTYNWNVPTGWSITGGSGTTEITVTVGAVGQDGNITVSAANSCGSSANRSLSVTVNDVPAVPLAGTHVAGETQIEWKWNTVTGATGYKWHTADNYGDATDKGGSTSHTETSLTCETPYTRFAWAYNACGQSSERTLTKNTNACSVPCPVSLTINHVAGNVAPETKTVIYGIVETDLGGTGDKCWITKNLGATNQASSATDNTDASAGWYWQFNRKQGYKVGPTPAWTITSISETIDWTAANDPCTIELGTGWRIPTYTEWFNANANGSWANYNNTYASVLKLHAAGYLTNNTGTIDGRGVYGIYWSSTQANTTNGHCLNFYNYSVVGNNNKAQGMNIRCLRD